MGSHQCPGKRASGSESQWISPLTQLRRHYPSAPHFSKARHLTVICSMLPVQCLYFYSRVCGLSLCGRERGAGYFLLLCIFLLYWEGFHFLPNSQFCLSWAFQALRPPCPTLWSTREWRTDGSWLPPSPLPDDHLGDSERKSQLQQQRPWGRCPGRGVMATQPSRGAFLPPGPSLRPHGGQAHASASGFGQPGVTLKSPQL